MSNQSNWKASLLEQQIAWGVALFAILLVIIAASQPQWFDFSSKPAAHSQAAPVEKVVPQDHAKLDPPKPAVAVKPVVKTVQKPVTIEPAVKMKQIVKETATPIKTKPQTASTRSYYVQIGAFEEKARAQGMTDHLKKRGWSVKVFKKRALHAVWIGPKATHEEAEKLLKAIQVKLKYTGFIVQSRS